MGSAPGLTVLDSMLISLITHTALLWREIAQIRESEAAFLKATVLGWIPAGVLCALFLNKIGIFFTNCTCA